MRRSVLLLDDHAIVREGLKALLELDGDLKVVAEASRLPEALQLARQANPDLILTDLMLPGVAGSQGIAELRRQCPDARIVVLSVSGSHERIRNALEAGANGYVMKDSSRQELFGVIRGVLNGERRLCAKASEIMLSRMLSGDAEAAAKPSAPTAVVSGRERMVIEMIASGASTKRIAKTLELSVKTVEKHRYNAMRKLGLRNVAQVTRFAIDSGMISRDRSGMTGRFRRLGEETTTVATLKTKTLKD